MKIFSFIMNDILYESDFFKIPFNFTCEYNKPKLSTKLESLLSILMDFLIKTLKRMEKMRTI